jgi:hypothetical protein
VDFFSPADIAAKVEQALREPQRWAQLRARARADAIAGFDLKTHHLPAHAALVEELGAGT